MGQWDVETGRRRRTARGAAGLIAALVVVALAGCAHRIPEAREEAEPLPSAREIRAERSMESEPCSPYWGWLFPGVAQYCMGKPVEGAALSGLAAGDVAWLIYLDQPSTRERLGRETAEAMQLLPAVSLQNVIFYNIADIYIEADLAEGRRYAPKESLGELAAAPFNPNVLSSRNVYPYVLAGFGVAAFQAAIGQPWKRSADRSVFGKRLPPSQAYPAFMGSNAFLNLNVAIGEETLFRGLIQSHFSREMGERKGLILSSLLFGLVHLANAPLYDDPKTRWISMALGVPVRASLGALAGYSYEQSGYRLSRSVANHFWWNFSILAGHFAGGRTNQFGLQVTVPF